MNKEEFKKIICQIIDKEELYNSETLKNKDFSVWHTFETYFKIEGSSLKLARPSIMRREAIND